MNRPTKPLAAGPPTISSVAALAGVSIATVSRCLNQSARVQPETRERVQNAVKQLGYSPNGLAQSFRRGRTNIVMVVMPHAGCPFLGEVLAGVREGIAGRYSIVIAEANLAEGSYEQVGAMLVSRQVDGLVLLATRPPFGTGLEDLARARRLPIVIGCESVSHELAALPSVQIDNFAAAHEATRHLIDLGHRRIAFVGGPLDKLVTHDRERGFRAAMAESGLPVPGDYVQAVPLSTIGGATAAARLLEARPRPSATFCGNDEMALGALDAYRRAGLRIPEDMSVMGFDDIRYAAIASPPLTTVAQPANAIGRRVAARIIEEIEGGAASSPDGDVLPYRLMIRESTGPCHHASLPGDHRQ